ncbi:unnamed protein product [Echinostoma caproni]|uniref:Rho-GAP domain-containing protein n=1 Tax=Echinostoma caproni TaxID=27848 RepID=A0A183APD2_9TREM|nr:unnamed protein product [Echinostoma caproni]
MYTDFLGACRQPQREKRLLSIQRLLSIMECYPDHPEYRAHRATLRYLATHLARVSAREAVNKMTAYNLALVFAPNLVQPFEDSAELLMTDSKYKIMLVETVIKYHAWIFSPDLGIESGCSVPTDSTEELPSIASAAAVTSGASSDLADISARSGPECSALSPTNTDSEDPTNQPGRLEGLRHLSQGCLDQYTTEARQLGARVAESRRQLQTTVAQRLQAEQLLMEARGQQHERVDPVDLTDQPKLEGLTPSVVSCTHLVSPQSSGLAYVSPGRQVNPKEDGSGPSASVEPGEEVNETGDNFLWLRSGCFVHQPKFLSIIFCD